MCVSMDTAAWFLEEPFYGEVACGLSVCLVPVLAQTTYIWTQSEWGCPIISYEFADLAKI